MTGQPIYFNPHAAGLEVFLGPTEARVMELCWERGPLTGKKVLFHWSGGSKPAYTTVTTVLARLADKELLQRRKQGRFYVYSPAITREEFIEKRLNLVLSCLDKHFPRRPSRKSRP